MTQRTLSAALNPPYFALLLDSRNAPVPKPQTPRGVPHSEQLGLGFTLISLFPPPSLLPQLFPVSWPPAFGGGGGRGPVIGFSGADPGV